MAMQMRKTNRSVEAIHSPQKLAPKTTLPIKVRSETTSIHKSKPFRPTGSVRFDSSEFRVRVVTGIAFVISTRDLRSSVEAWAIGKTNYNLGTRAFIHLGKGISTTPDVFTAQRILSHTLDLRQPIPSMATLDPRSISVRLEGKIPWYFELSKPKRNPLCLVACGQRR